MPLTFEFSRFRWSASWIMTALMLAVVVLCVSLGRWQWQRAQQKRALAEQFAAGDAAALEAGPDELALLPRYARVHLHGRYDPAHQFLLDNMSHAGLPGYQVLTPLHLAGGATVLVNRGWIAWTGSRRQLPDVQFDPGPSQSPAGRLDALPVAGLALGHVAPAAGADWPKLAAFPTMADLSAALGAPLLDRQLLLDPAEPFGYLRDWHPGGISAGRGVPSAI